MFLFKTVSKLMAFQKWYELLGISEDDMDLLTGELTELRSLIKMIIWIAFSLLVAGLILVIFYGGYLWISAGDREEQLQKAKKVIMNGVMGIVITFGFLVILAIVAGLLGVNITDFSFLDEIFGP